MEVTVAMSETGGLTGSTAEVTLPVGMPVEGDSEPRLRAMELLLMSLGTCMLGTMLTYARRKGLLITRLETHLTDEAVQGPEPIGCIVVTIDAGRGLSERDRTALRRAAESCKIHHTLKHPPEIRLDFRPS